MDMTVLARRVVQYTLNHPDERDCWMRAPAMTGILAWADEAELQSVDRWLQRAVDTQRTNGNLSYADSVQGLSSGHIRSFTPLASLSAPLGYPLLRRYQRNGNPSWLDAARRQVEALRKAPRTAEGGIWARAEGPELWIDFTYLMCPFLALFGKITGDRDAIDEAYRQYAVHVDHLVDPKKNLARHAWCECPDHYPQSTFWSRGNGWLICASVDLLDIAPDHPGAAHVAETLKNTLQAMATYQESSGYFCHVLDNPASNLEASGTLMFAYAAARAAALGLASHDILQQARRALRVVAGSIDAFGKVPGVAVPPGGPGVPFDWAPFGQGFFLLAADALKRCEEE